MATTIAPPPILAAHEAHITHHPLLDLAVVEMPFGADGTAYTMAAMFSRENPDSFLCVDVVPKPSTRPGYVAVLEQALQQIGDRQHAAGYWGDYEAAQLWQDMADAVTAYRLDTMALYGLTVTLAPDAVAV